MTDIDLKVLHRLNTHTQDSLILHYKNPKLKKKYVQSQPLHRSMGSELEEMELSSCNPDDKLVMSESPIFNGGSSEDSSIEVAREAAVTTKEKTFQKTSSDGLWINFRNSTFNSDHVVEPITGINELFLSPIQDVQIGDWEIKQGDIHDKESTSQDCRQLCYDDPPWLTEPPNKVLKPLRPRTYTPARKQNEAQKLSLMKPCKLRSSSPNIDRPPPKAKRVIMESLDISPIQHGEVYGDSVELVPRPETPGTVNSDEIVLCSLSVRNQNTMEASADLVENGESVNTVAPILNSERLLDESADEDTDCKPSCSGSTKAEAHSFVDLDVRSASPPNDPLQGLLSPKRTLLVRNGPVRKFRRLYCQQDMLENL